MEPPLLSIASLHLAGASLLEQRYWLRVRIRNPNPFDLPIEAMRYDLEINGRPFASGLSNEPVVVPRFGTSLVQMEAISTLPSFLRQLGVLGASPTFDYRLRGRLYFADGSALPFNYRGDVALTR
jgi:hypothetical protein